MARATLHWCTCDTCSKAFTILSAHRPEPSLPCDDCDYTAFLTEFYAERAEQKRAEKEATQ